MAAISNTRFAFEDEAEERGKERGKALGKEMGEKSMLFRLVALDKITPSEAAELAGMTLDAFQNAMEEEQKKAMHPAQAVQTV